MPLLPASDHPTPSDGYVRGLPLGSRPVRARTEQRGRVAPLEARVLVVTGVGAG